MTFVQQKFRKQLRSWPLTHPAIIGLLKKFDVTGTMEDLSRLGSPVMLTTAEHQIELVALIAHVL